MSQLRKIYFARLFWRIAVFAICIYISVFYKNLFSVLDGLNFFKSFSPLHILWIIWIFDMLVQIVPVNAKTSIGSQKLFSRCFKASDKKIDYEALKNYISSSTKSAYKIFVLWAVLITLIGVLYSLNLIDKIQLFLITLFFYVCDVICVVIWCPFRLIIKNRCCTTCRIFNWDHIMMFSPLIFMGGFFANSLVLMSFAAWLIWEVSVMLYPERFWEHSNETLKCSKCTDKLCTQYCKNNIKNRL